MVRVRISTLGRFFRPTWLDLGLRHFHYYWRPLVLLILQCNTLWSSLLPFTFFNIDGKTLIFYLLYYIERFNAADCFTLISYGR